MALCTTSPILTADQISDFRTVIWDYFKTERRMFAWRYIEDPYQVVVSEVMLQQTQTFRVTGKFERFITAFPHFAALAQAPLRDLLSCWQGLGYNRRTLYLQTIAQRVMNNFGGTLPNDPKILATLPGLGPATAASICVFSFNTSYVFIETNIRAVFIDYFFTQQDAVHDRQLLPLVEQTLDQSAPRDWYYALMDYGAMLKKRVANPNRKSAHYARQSKFEGSDRQLRGAIIRLLIAERTKELRLLPDILGAESARVFSILEQLCREGFTQIGENQVVMLNE